MVPRRARRVQLQRRHQLVRKVRAAISACEKDQQCEKEGAAAYPKLKSRWNAELSACRAEHRGRRRTLN